MVKVAVAGGAQGLGSAIVEGIESRGSHQCFILCRHVHEHDPRYTAVDCSSIEKLQAVLEANEIHTVISALSMENGGGKSRMNLIEAADRSKSTAGSYRARRSPTFVCLEAEGRRTPGQKHTGIYPLFQRHIHGLCDVTTSSNALDALRAGLVDLENNFAAIPGDGEGVVAMIPTSDIGRFVAAVLDLSQWEKSYHLIGDSLSIKDMVRVAEEVKGVAFEKHYDRKDSLLEHKCTLLPTATERLPQELMSRGSWA